MPGDRLYLFDTTLRAAAAFPSPRMRGEGAERRRREAGEGMSKMRSESRQRPLTRPACAALRRVDLSPQAGRGEGGA